MREGQATGLGARTVTRIGLGTNRLTDTPENHRFLQAAADAGIDLIDTAHLYTGGESEAAIGAALAPFPENLVVATKGGYRPGEGAPDRLRSQIEQSFERLHVDRISLYYLHRLDPETPLEETLEVLADYRDDGRIESIGLSEVSVEQIERVRSILPVAAVQNEYNLGERMWDEVVDHCAAEEIPFVAFYPLHGADAQPVRDLADRHGATPHQVALAWLLRRSPTMVPIPGSLSLDHVKQNLGALELELSDEDYSRLAQT
jgi:aryl-alcohol dehydrogenase-like predicted oxidoreductase